ncbi:MMPL family transporter [Streptomyces sp. NPDC002055]|uniref:MMPL family transporter n=1 Tax=Streptomyces sp. NPDC002055 TaxID=3154534 RepID=UPI0033314EEF
MLALMHGIGAFAVRFRYAVVTLWIAAAAVCVVVFPSLTSVANPDNSSFLPSDTGTSQALRLAAPFVPPGQSSATLVGATSQGTLDASDQSAFRQLQTKVAGLPHVTSVSDQGLSTDGKAQRALVVVDVAAGSPEAGGIVDDIRGEIHSSDPGPGVTEHLTGQLAATVDNQREQADAQRLTEILSNVVILVMLYIILRSALAPLVTLAPAALVLTMASPVIAEASEAGIDISSVTHPMLTVLLLGAGTDYGLFLVLRMREEMEKGAAPRDAVVRAVERVGESITFSAGTVIGALLCLMLASFGLYAGLGPALAIGVALMLLAALTLLPALLAISGRVLFWPRRLREHEHDPDTGWMRVVDHVLTRPKTTLVVGVLVFLALATGVFSYQSNGFGGTTNGPSGSDSAAGQQQLSEHYPPAVVSPTTVLLKYPDSIWNDLATVQDAENRLASEKSEFASVNGLFNPNGKALSVQQLSTLYSELGPPGKLPATPPAGTPVSPDQYAAYRALSQFVSGDGRTVQFYTTLTAGSPESTAAIDAVPGVRDAVTGVQKATGASESGVNGLAPASYDVSTVSNDDLEEIVPIVLVLIAVLLALVMRSLIAPLYLVVSVALSYFAALGLAVIVYIVIPGASGIDFVLPFLMFVFLMALGEDYNILVMSRIREEAHRMPLRRAVALAMHATGTTVTSAGLILAATFGVSALTGATEEIKQLGGSIAMGILLDTFLVRVLLVPATVILLGRWNWWPSALSRRGRTESAETAG